MSEFINRTLGEQIEYIAENFPNQPAVKYAAKFTYERTYKEFNEECDKIAVRSHNLACKAIDEGVFKEEIVPYVIKTKKGEKGGGFSVDFKSAGGGLMEMMGSFTVLRLITMAGGMMDAKFTKEDLLDLNKKLSAIKAPKKKEN